MKKTDKQSGIGLILAIFLIVIGAIIGAIALSLLTGGTASGITDILSVRAYGIAYGGMEWYCEQLQNDNDWSDELNQTGIALGSGTFDITIDSASSTSVSFTITSAVPGYENQSIQREMSITVNKFFGPFALYWGRHEATDVEFTSNMTVDGNYWSVGSTEIQSGSSVTNGVAYYGPGEDIYGAGTFSKIEISDSPSIPQINETYYDNLMSSYNTMIDAASGGDYNLSTDLVLSGNTINCRDFDTDGNITISGNGYIVATRNILLHDHASDSGTLTITPSGGSIYFLADDNIEVDSTKSDTYVTMDSGVVLYSRRTNRHINIINDNTAIDGAFIIAVKELSVSDSADLTNCTLYVPDDSAQASLIITGSGTTVTTSNIISVSPANKGLEIEDATVSGFVYHYGGASGDTKIKDATISGTVVCSYYNNHKIEGSTITYDWSSIPSPLPEGFDGLITKETGSWDDN